MGMMDTGHLYHHNRFPGEYCLSCTIDVNSLNRALKIEGYVRVYLVYLLKLEWFKVGVKCRLLFI